ncbi:hypothetical protein [Streptomyces sp. MB09-02B]|uniref:hypothetical protein n=1 Tax=Streptomyces sp. MB09-02B TaxID=3028667 RepID=UPI0029BEBE03|nr:hypothetical protein [Streptomyces sp. MB09-02B]MDX3642274.1 hypothetical protein [Streptomyces sp. MB09-02B]
MTESAARPTAGPDITRPDSRTTYLGHWFVDGPEQGPAVLDELVDAWQASPWPEGILTFSCYLSAESDTVMTYAQCTNDTVYRPFARGLNLPPGPATADPIEYRLHRSVVARPAAGPPKTVAVASFDVDGSERQRRIVAAIVGNLENAPPDEQAGLIASNFHLSVDGTRVINFAEWTDDEAHIAFLDGATRHRSLQITNDMPGVRPLGYRRYHLYQSLAR